MYHIAMLWEAQDNQEEAEMWYARVLVIREKALGMRHPKTKRFATAAECYFMQWAGMKKQQRLKLFRRSRMTTGSHRSTYCQCQ